MSNQHLENYKEQYHKFVSLIVNYYNRHTTFLTNVSEISSTDCRRMLKEMRELEKEMMVSIREAYLTKLHGEKELKRLRREQRQHRLQRTQLFKKKNGANENVDP